MGSEKIPVYMVSIPGSKQRLAFDTEQHALDEMKWLIKEGAKEMKVEIREMTRQEYESLGEFEGF